MTDIKFIDTLHFIDTLYIFESNSKKGSKGSDI